MPTPIKAALLLDGADGLHMVDVRLDDPLEHEVVVRTERVGLCHSDVHYVEGALGIERPALLGHEVAGIVESVGRSVTRVLPGQRVVATVTPSCGGCPQCLAGRPTQCSRVTELRYRSRPRFALPDGTAIQALGGVGAFGEAFLASEGALAVVPHDLPPEVACLLGCCITTGVGAVTHGARVSSHDTVAVIGCGGVGIAAIQGARLAGARRVVALDSQPSKLELAKRFGATDTILSTGDSTRVVEDLHQIIPGGVTHAIEAVGNPATASLAFDLLAPGGTATILGLMREGQSIRIAADALLYGDRRIQGAYMGANRFLSDVEMFVDHYRAGRLDLDAMVTSVLPFDQINEGLAQMRAPGTVRVVVSLDAS
ncbi:MAG: zinc-binding dehydrogenase [Dehalococcoidia bacterium]|jgi:alcohol dehydrogenase/S-(hydroxymethyl)glutathione dehydrogenase/alcohol dehydrogenase